MAAKIFRDPLYNYISIERDRDGWLLELLDCPEVQRLRRIHQLGVSYLTYPGADHNRLSHSLGVVHLMQEALDHLQTMAADPQIDLARPPLLAAALLHDIGHGPFSHLFEPCLGIDHEEWSCRILLSPESKVHQKLRNINGALPGLVTALIDKENDESPFWQKNLLSSQLDMDRLDYLRRDSLFTGAGYGHFDWYRLLHTFALFGPVARNRDLVWTDKAKFAIEEYIFSRFYMYQNVYLHKTTRGFEKLLQAMWEHARNLRQEGKDVRLVKPLAEFWDTPSPSVQQYLALEEYTVLSQIQEWTTHGDKALSDLARRFLERQGLAAIDVPKPRQPLGEEPVLAELDRELKGLVAGRGYEPPEVYALRDDLKTKIYDAYFPEKESDEQVPINAIRLTVEGRAPEEISELLPRLKAVTNKPAHQVRYYVPKELRKEAEELRRKWESSSLSGTEPAN
jgi:HD superfamily phosphohydrolase